MAGWLTSGGTLGRSAEQPKSGGYAGRFTPPAGQPQRFYQKLLLVQGSNHRFGGYCRNAGATTGTVELQLNFFSSSDATGPVQLRVQPGRASDLSGDYTFIATAWRQPWASSHSLRAEVIAAADGEAFTIDCDDFALERTAVTPTPVATLMPTPTATRTPRRSGGGSRPPVRTAVPTAIPTPLPPGAVVISEVLVDPDAKGSEAANEWLELGNRTGSALTLSGWSLRDNAATDSLPSFVIPARGYALIVPSTATLARLAESVTVRVSDAALGNGLANYGDRLELRDETGRLVDALSWGDDRTINRPPCPRTTPGASLQRGGGGIGAMCLFQVNPSPSPGQPNVLLTPTPTRAATGTPTLTATPTGTATPTVTGTATPTATGTSSPTATGTPTPTATALPKGIVVISEVLYDAVETGVDTAHEWVELYNMSSAWIEARRWTLSDNNLTDQLAEFSLPPRGVVVLTTRPLQALDGATVVIIDDGSLGNGLANTGDRLVLRDSYGNVLDALSWGNDASVFNPPCAAVAPGHSLERRFGEGALEGCPYAEAATPSLGRLPSATPTPSATATPLAATATPSATATPLTATAIPAAPVPPTVVLSPQLEGREAATVTAPAVESLAPLETATRVVATPPPQRLEQPQNLPSEGLDKVTEPEYAHIQESEYATPAAPPNSPVPRDERVSLFALAVDTLVLLSFALRWVWKGLQR